MNELAQKIAPAAIVKTVEVKAPIERAFAIFAGRIGEWWHRDHSLLKAQGKAQSDVVIEPRAGGRWYEVAEDGTEQEWGRVVAYEPPARLLLCWQLSRTFDFDPTFETALEILFESLADGGTRVRLEHRDLERFGEGAVDELESMDGGWAFLLDLFKAKADSGA